MSWTSVEDNLPPAGIPVIGYSPHWVKSDFNPKGMRECFLGGEGEWISADWVGGHDFYTTVVIAEPDADRAFDLEYINPTHWMPYPDPPVQREPRTVHPRCYVCGRTNPVEHATCKDSTCPMRD